MVMMNTGAVLIRTSTLVKIGAMAFRMDGWKKVQRAVAISTRSASAGGVMIQQGIAGARQSLEKVAKTAGVWQPTTTIAQGIWNVVNTAKTNTNAVATPIYRGGGHRRLASTFRTGTAANSTSNVGAVGALEACARRSWRTAQHALEAMILNAFMLVANTAKTNTNAVATPTYRGGGKRTLASTFRTGTAANLTGNA
jgi:hypothetical protein